MKLASKCLTLFLGVMLFSACTTVPTTLSTPQASASQQVVGSGKATAVGTLLFGFIPIMQNDRFKRAYDSAVEEKGGTAMVNPNIRETWIWTPIGNWFVTTVSGDVVK